MKFADVLKLGFDTETTGVDVKEARIVTAALVMPGQFSTSILINPGIEIPQEAADIHGVTTEIAREKGMDPREGIEWIAGNLVEALKRGLPVVAFNLSYDWSVLHYELERHGLLTIAERLGRTPIHLIDPYVLDKRVDKYRKGLRKLQFTADHYGVDGIEDWHSADADALAAVTVAEKIFERFPYLNAMSPEELYRSQIKWRREQCESLEAYFRNPAKAGEKYDPNAVVNPDWPLQK